MTDYTVIRSHRRTMALEVTREGAALVRAPYAASDAAIARFAAQHQAWLESHKGPMLLWGPRWLP